MELNDFLENAVTNFNKYLGSFDSEAEAFASYLLGLKYCCRRDSIYKKFIPEIDELIKETDVEIAASKTKEEETIKAKACPFCGSEDIVFVPGGEDVNHVRHFRIECNKCHSNLSDCVTPDETKIFAGILAQRRLLRRWNTRKEA